MIIAYEPNHINTDGIIKSYYSKILSTNNKLWNKPIMTEHYLQYLKNGIHLIGKVSKNFPIKIAEICITPKKTITQEIEYITPKKTITQEIKCITPKKTIKLNIIQNKGTGAGGSNTNKNGLPYEKLTDLNDCFTTIEKNKISSKIRFNKYENIFIRTKQSQFFKYMENHIDKNIKKAHGCKNPDECYINENTKTIFIIEKKFQQVSGSVCEKIQSPDFKLWQYNRTFPKYNIVYIYCLSEWFKKNCEAEIEYLFFKQIPVFWGNSDTYKDDIINFIVNYK